MEDEVIVLPCAVCHKDIQRATYPPHPWVHCDDFVHVRGTEIKSTGDYDHEAEPDVIEVAEVKEKPNVNTPTKEEVNNAGLFRKRTFDWVPGSPAQ